VCLAAIAARATCTRSCLITNLHQVLSLSPAAMMSCKDFMEAGPDSPMSDHHSPWLSPALSTQLLLASHCPASRLHVSICHLSELHVRQSVTRQAVSHESCPATPGGWNSSTGHGRRMARRQHDSASASRHILRLNDWLRLFWRHSAGAADGYRLRGGNPGSAHSLLSLLILQFRH